MWSRAPARMSSMTIDDETKETVTALALSIFTDCVNGGKTFQDTILAVYLSGLQNGHSAVLIPEDEPEMICTILHEERS
jgi:hypothetical protein